MWYYALVFLCSMGVDILPFFGPPAWPVMVFFQLRFGLNTWGVLVAGVLGSTLGRYLLSRMMPALSSKFINLHKIEDIEFIGRKLSGPGWKVPFFIMLYSLLPVPTTPLFTASGMARIPAIRILPYFFIGKFISDMVMVFTGNFVTKNATDITKGMVSGKSIAGSIAGILVIAVFMFIDWKTLLQTKRLRLKFNIFK
ncbi:MAG: hypothetical protein H7257_03085 [Taibaiella sp.]|nr:hypothetical protein [Taibaiella sp.]